MTDEQNADQPPEGEDAQNEQQTGDQNDPKTFDAEYVKELRKENAKYRTEAKANADAAKRLAEIEEANKTEAQRAEDTLKQQTERADKAEQALLRHEVAAEKGVPANAVKFLTGSTRDEIEASADDVLTLIGDAAKPRTPKPNPAQREGDSTAGDKDAMARAFFGIQ